MTRFYQELEHTADWMVRVWGESREALFEHAAEAMFELQGADLAAQTTATTPITCQAPDLEALLIAWLSELLFHSETANVVYTSFAVEIDADQDATRGFSLSARAKSYAGRGPLAHVKAVTYYNLAVKQTGDGWESTVTFDT